MQCGVNTYLNLDVRDVRDDEETLAARDIHGISVQSRAIFCTKKLVYRFSLN
jgi:hypothetical protein